MLRQACAFLALIAVYSTAPSQLVQAADNPGVKTRTDTPSGLPVPRFVSLKHDKTNCRAGPGFAYPVSVTFVKAGLPVEVVAETTDHWRKIRDSGGSECWAHQTTLGAVSHVLVEKEIALRAKPEPDARSRARLQAGVMARIERSSNGWLLVSVKGVKGWAPERALWGAPL